MNGNFKRALIVGSVLIGIVLLARYFNVGQYLTLQSLQENRAYLEQAVERNYPKAVFVYLLIYAAIIGLAIPGVAPLTIIGGFLFGFVLGGIYAVLGATIGSTISFIIMRYVVSGMIRGKYARRLEKFNEKIKSHGVASYLLTMQLLSVIPYFVINALAALANVPFTTFVWTTFVGAIPIIFVYSFAGRQLYLVQSVGDIFSPSIIIMFIILILLALVPMLLRRMRTIDDLE